MQTNAISPPDPYERLLQTLSTMQLQIRTLQLQTQYPSPDLKVISSGLTTLEQMTQGMLSVVRALTGEQPLPELEGRTLAEALSLLVEEVAEQLVLSSRIAFSGIDEQGHSEEHTLSHVAERVLYLFAREALYHIEQHQGTRKLRLNLSYGPDEVALSLEDDGVTVTGASKGLADETPLPFIFDEAVTGARGLVNRAPTADSHAPTADSSGNRAHTADLPDSTADSSANRAPIIDSPVMADLRYRIEQLGGGFEVRQLEERGTRFTAHVPYILSAPVQAYETDEPPASIDSPSPLPAPSMPDERIRVLIVDNQSVIRAGLHHLLETTADIQVVGEAADGVQAVSETLELGPQVVLLDAQLAHGESLEALRRIKQLNLDTRILLLTTQDREEVLYETLRAGADGYIFKESAVEELRLAIRAVARGEVHIQPQIAGKLLSRIGKPAPAPETLTPRELEVLQLLARGLRNKEIAARLYVSERTVNFHLANIYQKLNVSGRTEALSKSITQGLVKTEG